MDTETVRQAQAGDQDAFARLATESATRLHRVAYNILRDRELASDATQSALLSMWQSLPSLRDPARFEGWAYRTVVRACYAESKRTRRFVAAIKALTSEQSRAPDGIAGVETRDQLDRALAELSLDHRTVLVLRFHLDMRIDDIAVTLGIPIGTARSRLDRALKRVRPALAADLTTEHADLREGAER